VTGGQLVVQALNAGDGTLTLDPLAPPTPTVGADANWLTAGLLGDGKTIALTIDRTTEPDGAYQARVDVTSNGGTGSFLVDATVKAGAAPTPIGPVIVEVRDEQDLLVATVTTTFQEGYAWTIPDLPRGRYFVAAGVDLDSNGSIGDPGEPFGGYPTGAVLVLLEADQLDSIALDVLVQ
jgi:serine protease